MKKRDVDRLRMMNLDGLASAESVLPSRILI
jgi:hypothetical protein